VTKPRDIDLMQLADGELDRAQAARLEAGLPGDDGARAKLDAIRDLGEVVRGHLELRADEADPKLARMWGEIDKRIALDAAPSTRAKAPAKTPGKRGVWGSIAAWLDDHRGHVLTGLVSAGAVAAIMLWLRPAGGDRTVFVPGGSGDGVQPVVLKHQAAQIETLDTPQGSTGNVFTIEDDDGSTAVILVTPNDVEGT
jgi:hypothetical protein